MRILWNEVKKIFTWKTMLLLIFINTLLYFLLIEYYIEHFTSGDNIYSYDLGVEMVEKYGAKMDEHEFIDFQKTYEDKVEEANLYLQSREDAVGIGLDTYEKFQAYDWWNSSKEASAFRDDVFFDKSVDLFWELQEFERLITFYNYRKSYSRCSY